MGGNAHDKDDIIACFESVEDEGMKKQMGYILAAQRIVISEFEEDEDLMEIIGNVHLNGHFLKLAKELDVEEPKAPEDIYKTHLEQNSIARARPGGTGVDSARQNLASGTATGAFLQWKNENHFVVFNRPEAIHASMEFLRAAAFNASPVIERIPNPDVR